MISDALRNAFHTFAPTLPRANGFRGFDGMILPAVVRGCWVQEIRGAVPRNPRGTTMILLGDILRSMGYVAPIRARGFHAFGPPTMCGEGEPPTEPVVEVTCPRCVEILSSADAIAERCRELHAQGIRCGNRCGW